MLVSKTLLTVEAQCAEVEQPAGFVGCARVDACTKGRSICNRVSSVCCTKRTSDCPGSAAGTGVCAWELCCLADASDASAVPPPLLPSPPPLPLRGCPPNKNDSHVPPPLLPGPVAVCASAADAGACACAGTCALARALPFVASGVPVASGVSKLPRRPFVTTPCDARGVAVSDRAMGRVLCACDRLLDCCMLPNGSSPSANHCKVTGPLFHVCG